MIKLHFHWNKNNEKANSDYKTYSIVCLSYEEL